MTINIEEMTLQELMTKEQGKDPFGISPHRGRYRSWLSWPDWMSQPRRNPEDARSDLLEEVKRRTS